MDQTLDDFVAEELRRIQAFADHWRIGHAASPDQWPMAMPSGEWGEQLLGFEWEPG